MTIEALTGAVTAAARHTPDRTAVVHRGGEVSYAELAAATDRAGEALRALALPAGRPIAVRAVKSPQTIALVLACFTAGRPVLLLSVDYGAQVAGALVDRAGCAGVAAAAGDGTVEWTPAPDGADAPQLPPRTCLMLTTAGSTGVPKIVPRRGGAGRALPP